MFLFSNLFLLLAMSFGSAPPVHAHPLDLGYFQVELNRSNESLSASLELNPHAVERFSHLPVNSLNSTSIDLKTQEIVESTLQNIVIKSGETACRWKVHQVRWINEGQIRISADALCLQLNQDLTFYFKLLENSPPTFQILGKLVLHDLRKRERSFLIEKRKPFYLLQNNAGAELAIFKFIGMGVRHIGATPSEWKNENGIHFPDGIDHILFVFALILGGGGFLGLLKTATGFTLGHSVTLALATLGWVHFPSRLVESAIALSIVYVAFESLFLTGSKSRWKIAIGFGLVHGFGFASALQELNLSRDRMLEALIGFNFGVELGQALILAIIVPIVIWVRNYSEKSIWLVRLSAAMVGVIGSYWFVVRAFVL